MSGCYPGCYYYTDSCFRTDCLKGNNAMSAPQTITAKLEEMAVQRAAAVHNYIDAFMALHGRLSDLGMLIHSASVFRQRSYELHDDAKSAIGWPENDRVCRFVEQLASLGEMYHQPVNVHGKTLSVANALDTLYEMFRDDNKPEEPWDEAQALLEGWSMFEVDGRWQLQRDDEAKKFESDAEAIIFVASKANEGSDYHMRAIEMIGTLFIKD